MQYWELISLITFVSVTFILGSEISLFLSVFHLLRSQGKNNVFVYGPSIIASILQIPVPTSLRALWYGDGNQYSLQHCASHGGGFLYHTPVCNAVLVKDKYCMNRESHLLREPLRQLHSSDNHGFHMVSANTTVQYFLVAPPILP